MRLSTLRIALSECRALGRVQLGAGQDSDGRWAMRALIASWSKGASK